MAYGTISLDAIQTSANLAVTGNISVTGVVTTAGVFYENSQNVTSNTTITAGKSAMSAGPITIDSPYVVFVPIGSRWVIV